MASPDPDASLPVPAVTLTNPPYIESIVCWPHIPTGIYVIAYHKTNLSPTGQKAAVLAWLDYNPSCSFPCHAPTKMHFLLAKDSLGNNIYVAPSGTAPVVTASGAVTECMVCDDHLQLGFRQVSASNGNYDVLINHDETGTCAFCNPIPGASVAAAKYHLKIQTTKHYLGG